jgi:hypothetical protein
VVCHLNRGEKKMVREIRDLGIYGFKGIYTDKQGNSTPVTGTFALGPILSWYDKDGNYRVVDGIDQE